MTCTWLYIVGINPRTGLMDIFALTQDHEDAERQEVAANRDGWRRVRITAEMVPAPVLHDAA